MDPIRRRRVEPVRQSGVQILLAQFALAFRRWGEYRQPAIVLIVESGKAAMAHLKAEESLRLLVDNTIQVLSAHGYEIVTPDKALFPRSAPTLAALKGGRLLVFAFSVSPSSVESVGEVERLRVGLEDAVEGNAPGSDPRVGHVEKVAVMMAPESADLLPEDDIQWIVVDGPEELSERLHADLAL